MSFFDGTKAMPLLQAAKGLYASSARGGRTGEGIADGLLGYKRGQASQASAAQAAEQAKFERSYKQAQMEKIQAESSALGIPKNRPTGTSKS